MKTNIFIIGGGPGGYQTALYAASLGLKVVLAEKYALGGTCLNRGCIPTKALLHDARVAQALPLNEKTKAFQTAMKRKDEIVSTLRQRVDRLVQANDNITIEHGHALLLSQNTVAIDGNKIYNADFIVIATGSHSFYPPITGIFSTSMRKNEFVVNPEEILSLSSIPKKLCIVGAGVIGMEMAVLFNGFGSKVTVIEALPECLPNLDQEIARRVRKSIEKQGVNFFLSSQVSMIDRQQIHFIQEKKGQNLTIDADLILIATGRKPFIKNLGLEQVNVQTNHQSILVNQNMQTNIPNIYAIGDVNGLQMLAHAAVFQGKRAINHILGESDTIRFEIMPSAIFTIPEAASVGLTEKKCKEKDIDYKCWKSVYRSNGRAMAIGESDGLVKILCTNDEKKTIIGCQAFGKDCSYLVQEIASLMTKDIGLTQLHNIIHIHPTLTELLLQTTES